MIEGKWRIYAASLIFGPFAVLCSVTAIPAAEAEIVAAPGVRYEMFATGLRQPRGLLITKSGEIFLVEQAAGTVVKLGPDGHVRIVSGGLSYPHDVEVDSAGNFLVADTGNNRVALVSQSGIVSTYIGDLDGPVDLAASPGGELLVCELSGKRVVAYKTPARSRVLVSGFGPHGLAFLSPDITLISDTSAGRVVRLDNQGIVTPFATDIGTPIGVAIGPSGDVYTAERAGGRLLRLKQDGSRIVLLEGLSSPRDPAFDASGNLYLAETDTGRVLRLTGNF